MFKTKKYLPLWLTILFGIVFFLSVDIPAQDRIEPQKVIVKLNNTNQLHGLLKDIGGTARDTIGDDGIFLIELPDTTSVEEAIATLENDRNINFVQPNYLFSLPETDQINQTFPDESAPIFIKGEQPISYYDQEGAYIINCDSAHLIATGFGVTVAVIDNGIAMNHPLFEGAILSEGFDFIDHDSDPSEEPGDAYGHGTFVSGVIKLVAPDCMLLPLRAFDETGTGTSFAVASAIHRAVSKNVDVINMSFGLYSSEPVIQSAISRAVQNGITMFAAPGNESTDSTTYPAAYPGVIAVSAIDSADYIADFSNYGNYINICAPGVNVYSALAGQYEWGIWSGTSFSTPFAGGVGALILELDPQLNGNDVESILENTAERDLQWGTLTGFDPQYGFGRVDALNAVLNTSLGDVNNDSEVDEQDIDYLSDHIYNGGPAPQPVWRTGDMDFSGKIDLNDLTCLIKRVNGGHQGPPK